MRKTLSIIISVLMIASLFAFGVNAAEGTAINTADEFMAMAADGTYYLNADITLAATFEPDFTGTLDGNGHTVTVSAPMFKQMNGTVKNLTTVGEINVSATVTGAKEYTAIGAVAGDSKGGQYANITNKANITVTVTVSDAGTLQSRVGGIAGRLNNSDTPCSFTNCTNEGNITSDGSTGGIVGGSYSPSTVFDGCVNKGTITNTDGISGCFAAAGICGYSGQGAITVKNSVNYGDVVSACRAAGIIGDARKSATIENCTNNGKISLSQTAKNAGGATTAGGIVGYALGGECVVDLTFTDCVNNGEVVAYVAGSADGVGGGILGYAAKSGDVKTYVTKCVNNATVWGGNQAGGAIGYLYGSGSSCGIIDSFINNGDMKAGKFASEFMAYANSKATVVKNSIGIGKLVDLNENGDIGAHLVVIGLSSADITKYTYENVFMADQNTATHFSWTATEANAAAVLEISAVDGKDLDGSDTVKAITRGELNDDLIAKANAAVGSNLFALKDGKVLFASQVTEPETTTPETTAPAAPETDPVTPDTDPAAPETTTEPSAPETGDNAIIVVAAVAVVAILGVCVIGKKKVTD